jgi:hypothetical protein
MHRVREDRSAGRVHSRGLGRTLTTTPRAIAVHEPGVERKSPASGLHADLGRKIGDGKQHSSSLVSSAVGNPSATHSFF